MAEENLVVCNEEVNVEISKDKMLGVISFVAPQNGGRTLTPEEIKKEIADHGVVQGFIEENINELVYKHEYGYKYIIAQGKKAVDGEDGQIVFHFDTKALKELKPKINEDGSVDLRDLSAVKNVKKGDVLATKVPATQGEDGYNVLGQVIKARKGKEARIPKGKNTTVLPDNLTLVADIDGKLEYDDHNVYINSVYNIMGDLDSSIGNVDFVGDVVIYGNVHSGFRIQAGGSVEVKGTVEDVTIIAGKDIILNYGVQGTEKSKLVAGGNVITKFIQNAHVEAGGTVTAEAILHSVVTAGDSIHADSGKGTIVGGSAAATNLIIAKSIGSPMGTVTALQIGMPPHVYTQYKELGQELKEKRESLNKVDQSIAFLMGKAQGGLDTQKKLMLQKFNATRQPLSEEYEEIRAKYNAIGERLNNIHDGLIRFTDTVYPGVKVTYGNIIKYIDERYAHSVIRKSDGEIVIE